MPMAVGMTVSVPLSTGAAVFLHRCTPSGGSGSRAIGVTIGTGMTAFLHGHAPDCSVILPLPGGQSLLNNAPHFSGTQGFRQPAYSSLLKEGHRLTGDGIPCKENEPLLQRRILLQRSVKA